MPTMQRYEPPWRYGQGVLCALAMPLLIQGCGPSDCPKAGLLEDTPLPQLCLSDELRVSPLNGILAPNLGESGDAGTPDGLSDQGSTEANDGLDEMNVSAVGHLAMSVSGLDENGRAREAAHVEILLSTIEGTAASKSVARLVAGDGCEARTDVRLHCQLDVHGIASFELQHLNNGGGRVKVCAESSHLNECGEVTVVGAPEPRFSIPMDDEVLSAFENLDSEAPVLTCTREAPQADCEGALRRVSIPVQLFETADGSDEMVGAPGRVIATVKVGAGTAFLTTEASCGLSLTMRSEEISLAFATGEMERMFSLCIPRNGGTIELEAVLDGAAQEAERDSLVADPMPTFVLVPVMDGQAQVAPKLLDCAGQELSVEVDEPIDFEGGRFSFTDDMVLADCVAPAPEAQ